MLSQSSPPSNLYTFHVHLTSFTCDSLYYGDRLHKNLCLYFKKTQGFVQKVERQFDTWWWDFQKNMTWICWFGWKSGTTSDMNYGHVLFWHKCKPQFIRMHAVCYCQTKYLQAPSYKSPAHLKSNVHMKITQSENGVFPHISKLRALAYVQGSKCAGNCVRDTNNPNARWNLKASLESIQDGLSTWDKFYLDL